MSPELAVALVAVVISVASLVVAVWSTLKGFRSQTWAMNQAALVSVEQQLAHVPTALRFHGIEEPELAALGLTAREFAYLVASFTAGGIFYRNFVRPSAEPFERDSYRYAMCLAPATRAAWPLLKRMLNADQYRARIEATMRQIEEEGAVAATRPMA